MENCILSQHKLMAVLPFFLVYTLLVFVSECVSIDQNSDKILGDAFENYVPLSKRYTSMMLKVSSRFRREDDGPELSKQDELRQEYERRLFESLNIIGSVEATRLYVPEYINKDSKNAFNIEIGTVVGKVRKLFPHGKQMIVWPYLGWRNFTVDENTGDVKTTAKMDFELIWLYNMTIRDFKYNYSDPEPLRVPPVPSPEVPLEEQQKYYVDHYLIIEVVDRNDHAPKFPRDIAVSTSTEFNGYVNTNALAGTPVLYIGAIDDDSGPRGRIRYSIKTIDDEQSDFTIDPKTHILKTTGNVLKSGDLSVEVEALDYGMPPERSGFQAFTVKVEKVKPQFTDVPYNLNFSEALVPGSVVGKVRAISKTGLSLKYSILTPEARKTFAINHLGEITLLRELDYDTANSSDKDFTFMVRATEDVNEGRTSDVQVNMKLLNADDHLGLFKTPAKVLEFREGSYRGGGDIYKVDVEDCDCKDNCQCKSNEMIYRIGDTKGFFDISSSGQIQNIKDLDYEKENYFFFPVTVIDPGANGRTRTSYVEINVLDVDDTAPKFPFGTYEFSIFEDAPKGQVIGVAQAEDPDPATKPEEVTYDIRSLEPNEGYEYFEVASQGVIKVLKNPNQFSGSDKYAMTINARDSGDKVSDPPAVVTIRVLDVNDHQPTFEKCESQEIAENEPVGTILTRLTATDKDRGVNKEIEYSLVKLKDDVFKINNATGQISTTEVLDREKTDTIFVVAKATDGGAGRSEPLRQVGYCQFIVEIKDVNDNHPEFTVEEFDVTILRSLKKGGQVLYVKAIDKDLGDSAKIEYAITSQTISGRTVNYLEVVKTTGEVRVKNGMTGLGEFDRIDLIIQATNKAKVIGPKIGKLSETTVRVSFSTTQPPKFTKSKYTGSVTENSIAGTRVLTLGRTGVSSGGYSLQTPRDRNALPFSVDSTTGEIKTTKPLNFEDERKYIFAVSVGQRAVSSAIVEIEVKDIDDVVPIFGKDKYEATISEAAGTDANVFRVQASDPDPHVGGGKIVYTIEKRHDYQAFQVVEGDGYAEIKTASSLKKDFFDREKKSSYTIVMQAQRKGSASNMKSTALLIINVRDENDSPPKFKDKFYTALDIAENVEVPFTVLNTNKKKLKVEAIDNDILENAQVYYYITSGNDGRFHMETRFDVASGTSYGELKVVRPLDAKKTKQFETKPVYNLTVTATDRKHTAEAYIIIRVLDRPDSKPEFLEPFYEKYLPENAGPGIPVVQVEVKKPEDPKAVILFSLDEKATPYFVIDEKTGLITTFGEPLDWEKTPAITFPVYAYEQRSPQIKGQTVVRVEVNDVNDASPTFPDQPYVGYVKENSNPGTLVRYINAIDKDNPDVNGGRNVKLTYELVTNTGEDPIDKDGRLFQLSSNGKLTTRVKLNAEEFRRNLTIRVRAWDDGIPRLYGETDVTVVIRDVSEFPAWFRKEEYEATVSETQPPGFVVLQLTTKDQDYSPRNNYAFSIKSGNSPYAFDINQYTGEIVVAGVLDIDGNNGKRVYKLTVGLKERSDQLLVNHPWIKETFEHTAEVRITVTQGNDNRPTFTKPDKKYSAIIPENTPVGSVIENLVIEARDNDKGFSSDFRFYIQTGNLGDWFAVEKISNTSIRIKIQYPLDREFQDVYLMRLVVIDNGGVSDMAWLEITLTDINDNPPMFLSSYYKVSVKETGCDTNTPLATLTVVDRDLPEQGPFVFTLKENPGNYFTLRSDQVPSYNTTKLYCSRSIDRENVPNVKLVVQATDKGPEKLSSTVNVYVHVQDVDDKGSESSATMRVILNAFKGKFIGGPIAKTYFQDEDGDSVPTGMKYSLTGSDEFTVKTDDGRISAKSTVKVGKYQLTIQGSKGSSRPKCEVDVTVRDIPEEAIENSAAIQFHDVLNTHVFLNPIRLSSNRFDSLTYYDRFVNMLSQLFDVPGSNVYVFSVQVSKQFNPGSDKPSIDVHFAIKKESSVKSDFLPRWLLINVLEKNNATIKKLNLTIGMIGLDYCAREDLKSGMCQNTIVGNEDYTIVNSDYGLRNPVPSYAVSMVSIKVKADGEYDRYHQDPDPEYDECVTGGIQCLNGGTCHNIVPRGFVCECPGAYSGPRCQLTTRTFKGSSYIWLPPKTPHNFGRVSLEFATGSANGLLLYQGPAVKGGNNGYKDFLAISLQNGRIMIGLSFGGEKPIAVSMDEGPTLNNKKWHHVEIKHQGKEVTVIIDHCKKADMVQDDERIVERREHCQLITKTTQNFQYLNGLGPMQIGGIENMPLDYIDSKYIVYKYFDGCIRKIEENLEMYDLAYPLKVVNAPAGCTVMAPCPDCKNGGYCFPGFARSVCSCPAGYVGDDCSGNAPRYWYLANSFTEYKLPGEERRRRRAAVNEPGDLLDRYTSHIAMQIRVDPEVTNAIFFFAVSEDGLEYSILAYEEQKLYYEFKLLDALVRLEMDPAADVADGEWHNVFATRKGNMAVLQVDYKGRVSKNTGGTKQLIRMSSAKIIVGGLPDIAPNTTTVKKVVEAAVTDIRYRRRRSAGTIIGVTSDGRAVSSVGGDMQGCTGSSTYNGKNLDTNPNVKKVRFNVVIGCPCRAVLQCRNGGYCVSAKIPFCQCTHGWSGRTCEDVVYVALVLGNRVDGRARWQDGGVLVVILVVVLCVMILAIALLLIKKRREAPFSVPVGDEGQDSIMPYHDDGAGEEDTFNYDIHHLMKYSYKDGHGTITKSVNGKELAAEHIELLNAQAPDAADAHSYVGGVMMTERKGLVRESVDLWPFILERVHKADEDISWWPGDEMRHWADEGDEGEFADLSEIEESDDEDEAEQDWEFLKDWGKKFEGLNKIFNPEDDDEEGTET